MARCRVLLADDVAPVLRTVMALLRDSFDVIGMVSDGLTALNVTLKLEPDLVVLDISMPEISGIETARELKRRSSKTKIVFLTALEDTDILQVCQDAGGLGYVVKAHMATDLIPAMNDALAGRMFTSKFSSRRNPNAIRNLN
jgi:DNA-binding NarL/FixJ family response regulator